MRKKKKVKFKKYVFKLSYKQKELIDKFCKIHKTTPNKMIRKALKEFLMRNVTVNNDYCISENQLSIFDELGEDEYENAGGTNDITSQDNLHNLSC